MEDLISFLNSLYVPESKRATFNLLMYHIQRGKIREFRDSDKGLMIPIVEIVTHGHKPRMTFQGYRELFADTGKMGVKMGEIAVHDRYLSGAYPVRFRYHSFKYLIKEK